MHERRMSSRLLAKNEYKRQINAGEKVNWSRIGREAGLDPKHCKKWVFNDTIMDKPRKRSSKITKLIGKRILELNSNQKTLEGGSTHKIANTISYEFPELDGISHQTIFNFVKKQGNKPLRITKKFSLKKIHSTKRFQFTEEIIKRKITSDQIFFTDEKYFGLNTAGNPQIDRLWTTPEFREKLKDGDEDAHNLISRDYDRYHDKIMVSGAVCSNGVSKLQFFVGTQNKKNYIQSLSYFKQDIDRLSENKDKPLLFQYDLASTHKGARKEMREIFSSVLPIEWPPKGADFSPIELVWAHIENELHRTTYENIHQLKYALEDLWNRISPKLCKNLVRTFDKRVRIINKLKGRRYSKLVEKKLKSNGELEDIFKHEKIRKTLKKKDFEIKNYYTKYWNQPKDNLEIVLYNDDFLKAYLKSYTEKLEKKLKKNEKIFKANEKQKKKLDKEKEKLDKCIKSRSKKMKNYPMLDAFLTDLTDEKFMSKKMQKVSLFDKFEIDIKELKDQIKIYKNMSVEEFKIFLDENRDICDKMVGTKNPLSSISTKCSTKAQTLENNSENNSMIENDNKNNLSKDSAETEGNISQDNCNRFEKNYAFNIDFENDELDYIEFMIKQSSIHDYLRIEKPKDGNCFFNCILEGFNDNENISTLELRKICSNLILESDYDDYIEGAFEVTKNEYANDLEINNAWGGELEANLLALNYNIWICILQKIESQEDENWYIYKNIGQNTKEKRPNWYLFLLNESDKNDKKELSGHYSSLKNPYIPRINIKF